MSGLKAIGLYREIITQNTVNNAEGSEKLCTGPYFSIINQTVNILSYGKSKAKKMI